MENLLFCKYAFIIIRRCLTKVKFLSPFVQIAKSGQDVSEIDHVQGAAIEEHYNIQCTLFLTALDQSCASEVRNSLLPFHF